MFLETFPCKTSTVAKPWFSSQIHVTPGILWPKINTSPENYGFTIPVQTTLDWFWLVSIDEKSLKWKQLYYSLAWPVSMRTELKSYIIYFG